MDIISHGFWGGIAFGRKNRRSFWLSFLFGVLPDLLSFGLFTPLSFLGFVHGVDWSHGLPPPSVIPQVIYTLYNWTHSFIVFLLLFLVVAVILRRPLWELSAWGLHIFMDIFTHSYAFFPTPFLWPLSSFKVNSIPWISPEILVPDVILLAVLYGWFFIYRRRKARQVPL